MRPPQSAAARAPLPPAASRGLSPRVTTLRPPTRLREREMGRQTVSGGRAARTCLTRDGSVGHFGPLQRYCARLRFAIHDAVGHCTRLKPAFNGRETAAWVSVREPRPIQHLRDGNTRRAQSTRPGSVSRPRCALEGDLEAPATALLVGPGGGVDDYHTAIRLHRALPGGPSQPTVATRMPVYSRPRASE